MNNIDINEKELYEKHPKILDLLLIDNTTKRNIIWGTDLYKRHGYKFSDSILPFNLLNTKLITPRSKKAKSIQLKRSKDNAEVFTPSWICNKQNNLIDEAWFERKNVFNIEIDNSWTTIGENIEFPKNKSWIDYVKDIRLEISCGEAPYLVSRYDTVTGNFIDINNRIGLLDRKLRIVNENTFSNEEWIEYALEALKAIYGYEWQGDNLLLARKNVLFTFIDYYQDRFNEMPSEELLIKVTTIISWNLWQMDGLKCVIPNSCNVKRIVQYNLFGEEIVEEEGCAGCLKGTIHNHNGTYSKIMDWEKNKKIKFIDLIKGGYNI